MKKPLMALGLGALFCIILLELTLWLVWLGQSSNQVMPSQLNQVEGKFLIATLGNSYTYGIGANDRVTQSYPAQLKNLLNERAGGDRVEVHNLALGNMTSGMALRALTDYLKIHKPAFVTLRLGEPNVWSPHGYLEYLERTMGEVSNWYRVRDLLSKARIYKLIGHMTYQYGGEENFYSVIQEAGTIMGTRSSLSRHKSTEHAQLIPESEERVIEVLRAYSSYFPDEVAPYLSLGMIYYSQNEFEKGLELFEEAHERFPGYLYQLDYVLEQMLYKLESNNSGRLRGRIKKLIDQVVAQRPSETRLEVMKKVFMSEETLSDDNTAEYEEVYQYFLEHTPGRSSYASAYIYNILVPKERFREALDIAMKATLSNPTFSFRVRDIYQMINYENKITPEIEKLMNDFKASYQQRYNIVFQLDSVDEATAWALSDIDVAIEILNEKEIPYLLLNYPPPVKLKRPLDQAIRKHAIKNKYNFIDTREGLETLFQMSEYKKSHFYAMNGTDEHPNERGYAIMAQELADYIWLNFKDQIAKKE